jgi:hypothetical protein
LKALPHIFIDTTEFAVSSSSLKTQERHEFRSSLKVRRRGPGELMVQMKFWGVFLKNSLLLVGMVFLFYSFLQLLG